MARLARRVRFSLPVDHPHVEAVAALFDEPAGAPRGSAFLLAHGAGSHMEHPGLAALARGLAAHGFAVLRFDYAYRERARRAGRPFPPDARERLEHVHERARAELERRVPGRRLILAGRSMGGRIGSHLAATGAACAGLVLVGYPLHPPGRPELRRDEHFAAIAQPALFLQGTRDELCDLALLEESLQRYGGRVTLEVIQGADHGFHVPRSSGRTDAQVQEQLLERIERWERETFPR